MADKDTIYVDVDDEITGIIDKLKGSSSKLVALVLPKRATVFQSIVNMKLLKRAADQGKKNLVLITSEAGLLPLAGAAGIHVAKTLTSKPEIPSGPVGLDEAEEKVEEPATLPDEPAELPEPSPLPSSAKPPSDSMETVNFDNEDKPDEAAGAGAAAAEAKKDKKLKVPNFERFRLVLGIATAVVVLLIILFLWLNSSLAHATINISTNATNVPTNLNLNLSTSAATLDPSSNTLPAKLDQSQKTYTQQVPTTGQKNNGNKASGQVNLQAQICGVANLANSPPTVPAGTGLSANSQTYITQQDTNWQNSGQIKNGCATYDATSNTPIQAQSGGSSFNVGGVNFTASGTYNGFAVSGNGSASGGTDNIVQTVNQNDINNAKSKINASDSTVKQALSTQLASEGYFAITASYNTASPNVTTSSSVGQVANNVTVTETVNYSMFGVHKTDLKTVIDNSVDTQIDTSKQSVLDEGIDQATFTVNSATATGAQVNLSTKAVAGPQLDVGAIKRAAEGKKAGDVTGQISSNPNVTSVKVSFSPFWVSTVPKNVNKISVKIAKPTTTKS